jgi:hypothetical protein
MHDEILQSKINACYEELRLKGKSKTSADGYSAMPMRDNSSAVETIWFNHVYYYPHRETENDEWSKWVVKP